MGNISNTRFPNGLTNVGETNIFADMRMPDPTQVYSFLDDFNVYTAASWVVTATGSTTQALTAGTGGWLLVTNSAANNDLVALQKTPSSFTFTAGKKAFFKARFKVNDATASSLVMGIQVIDTTPLDVTDGVYFLKSAASTALSVICRKDATTGSTSASAIANMADDTFIELAWYYDGDSKIQYAVNGSVLGSLAATSATLPDSICTVSFALQNGAAAAKTMTVDLIFAAFER